MTTYTALFTAAALSGTVIPVPEDVTVLVAGSQAWAGTVNPVLAGLTVASGLFLRDSVFFGIGHFLGESVLVRPWVVRLLQARRIEAARDLVARRGGRAVLVSRFMVGARSSAFLVAGALGVRPRDFALWDGVGLVVSVPLVMALGVVASEPMLALFTWLDAHKLLGALGLAVVVALWLGVLRLRQATEPG